MESGSGICAALCILGSVILLEKTNVRFSIIVPVYNVEKELPRCIDSVLNQDYESYEIIIIDDGSTDSSARICDQFQRLNSKVKVVHKENGGLSSARNEGVKRAVGDYLVFLDSDDYLEKCFLSSLSETIDYHSVDIIAIDKKVEKGGKIKRKSIKNIQSDRNYNITEFLISTMKSTSFNAEATSNVFRLSFWKEHDFRFKENIFHEDMEISLRLFLSADSICYCPRAIYHTVARQGSIMSDRSNAQKRQKDLIMILTDWIEQADRLHDKDLKLAIKGTVSRVYIFSCALNSVICPGYEVMTRADILKYSLSLKDRLKAIMFITCPILYVNIWQKRRPGI